MVGTERPSRSLYKDKKFEKHIQQIEENKSSNNSEKIIPIINNKFAEIFQEITAGFINDDEIMCCRNINYYFDLLYAIIKSPSGLSNDIANNLINQIEHKWNEVPKINNKDECKGETDLDSTRKRCVLKHIHDLKMDEKFIKAFSDDYSKYLHDKWKKIIDYTSTYYGGLYIKIENDSVGIIEEYTHFLYSLDYICDVDLSKLSTDDITISRDMDSLMNNISLERISPNNNKKECYNKVYIDMLKKKTSNIKKINNVLSSGIALLGFSLILILIYKFSPLGSLLRRYTKKKIEVDENMNEEEMSELYNNSENEKSYISYYSVSH
ncbi:PIR Superfamily Protein [Plasmodium ovale wallikeri]|uniref:PIR Superfamily Protein n=1 Tax=Plasmodium ovale wallikeri TaxID=864142 RepID=A0A1A9AKZ8_PLAOA|nr:PIR Superfamily Protein [Plasmodium ovale wallikeri]